MEFLILKKGGGSKVHPLWLPNIPNLRWPCWSFRKTLGLCHLCIQEANHCDEMTAQRASHLWSGLVVVDVPGAGWVLGLLVMDRQRSGAELPSNGCPVFSPNPMGSLQLEVHLVYLALSVRVSEDSSPLHLLLRYGDLD